ncbi:hypothetical protein HX004_10245 [Myroides sp. 1354]|nr:hypothetical protein [Myroides sp. R163-1]MDM1056150.1 hypothetical protein [Myroides sp. 1354]MDM1069279.1 hypothetical protein [Myroides sp. 1372]
MKKGVLNIKVDYRPLNTYKNAKIMSGSTRQNYNANTRYFEPDRRIDPYVVWVECGVNDVHKIVSGLVNSSLTDVSWKISSATGYQEILTTDKEFKIGTGDEKGKITIFKNVSDLEPVTLLFSARFIDATTKRVVNFQESFNLVTLPVAQAPIAIETAAPVGYNLFPTENNQGLICQADLYQGKEKVPAAYWWYKGTTLLTEANGYKGTAKNQLFVPASALTAKGDIFKCEVADCSEYFNGLVQQKVEADTEVIEWRNLYQTRGMNILEGTSKSSTSVKFEGWNLYAYNSRSVAKPNTFYTASYFVQNSDKNMTVRIFEVGKDGIRIKESDNGNIIPAGSKGVTRVTVKTGPETYFVEFVIRRNTPLSDTSLTVLDFSEAKLEESDIFSNWSPSKKDLQDLTDKKTAQYKSNTSLPENYRPNPKPTKLYTDTFMLMKKFPKYEEEILYPTSVSPDSTTVQVEMVLNTSDGIIKQPERFFSVGWLKQANGTFKYKGFKVKIAIADIKALNEANKQLDYELREDLTLKA